MLASHLTMLVARIVGFPVFLLALSCAAWAGTPGIFQGRVYQDDNGKSGWIYVQSRNGMLRRVEVSRARVVYGASVPAGDRDRNPAADLIQGAEVQVTAEQDGAGEWRASRVEILKISRRRRHKTSAQTLTRLRLPLDSSTYVVDRGILGNLGAAFCV